MSTPKRLALFFLAGALAGTVLTFASASLRSKEPLPAEPPATESMSEPAFEPTMPTIEESGGFPRWTGELPELDQSLLDPSQVEPISKAQFAAVLAHNRGKAVIVNLWATWCIPCRQELPELNLLQTRYEDQVRVITVSLDTPDKLETSVRESMAKAAPDLTSYLQTEEDEYEFIDLMLEDWLGVLPTTIFIDPQGRIVRSHAGRMLYKQFEEELLALLEEPAAG